MSDVDALIARVKGRLANPHVTGLPVNAMAATKQLVVRAVDGSVEQHSVEAPVLGGIDVSVNYNDNDILPDSCLTTLVPSVPAGSSGLDQSVSVAVAAAVVQFQDFLTNFVDIPLTPESAPGPLAVLAREIRTLLDAVSDDAEQIGFAMGAAATRFADMGAWYDVIKALLVDHEATEIVALGENARAQGWSETELALYEALSASIKEASWPLFRMGVILFDRGQTEAALPLLIQVTDLDPSFSWGWYYRAITEDRLGGAAASLASLKHAVALSEDDALNLLIAAFSILTKLPWTDAAADVLGKIICHKSFSDADLAAVAGALSQAAQNQATLIASPLLMAALKRDVESAALSPAAAANWWPIHMLVALCAIESMSPKGGELMQGAMLALQVSTSHGAAASIFRQYLHRPTANLIYRLVLRPPEDLTEALNNPLLDLADACMINFEEPFLAGLLLDFARTLKRTPAQTRRLDQMKVRIFERQNAHTELNIYFRSIDPDYIESNTDFFHAKIYTALSLAERSGDDLIREIERVLNILERKTKLPAHHRAKVIGRLEHSIDRAFSLLYDAQKRRATQGDHRLEADLWNNYLGRISTAISRMTEMRHRLIPGVRTKFLRRKVIVLTSPYIPQVRYYRAEQLIELLHEIDIPCEIYDLNDLSADRARTICSDASIVVFQRQPATPFVLKLMSALRILGTKIVYDIDDLIFDLDHFPPPIEDYEGNIDRATFVHLTFDCPLFSQAMQFSDEIIVSTETLRTQARKLVGPDVPIHLRRNYVGMEAQMAAARALDRRRALALDDTIESSAVRIFYGSGTKAHKTYFMTVVVPALVRVLEAHEEAELVLIGHFPDSDIFESVIDRVEFLQPQMSFSEFLDFSAKHDINIAPLDISEATNAKSELKWFESAVVGMPSVVSPTQNYIDAIKDGVHALFADSEDEWFDALSRLVTDADLRKQLVDTSMDLIRTTYSARHWAQLSLASGMLDNASTLGNLKRRGERKKRLLVVNTFFWPQSVGGATRIAETYVDELMERYGEEFEIFILTASTDSGDKPPYHSEMFWYGNALVTQISVPMRDWADAEDSRIELMVADMVRRYCIDVAHLHSIQILTASVATALQAAGIPVILTLHDAWWLSEHQFLVDDDGTPFLPAPDSSEIFSSVTRRMTSDSRLHRRRLLRSILVKCDRVVAVSENFAQVYRNAGFGRIDVHENGVNALALDSERHRPEGKVRIGFIGGRSEHKGHGLLYRALLRLPLPNIELIIIDHAQPYGYEREGQIGDSRVITLGKFPQDRVTELYSRFDILAAPSIWPESYGLVTREARFAGLPVLVSNRGDISRGVEHGVDGWVVDLDDPHALDRTLTALNDNPGMADLRPRPVSVVSVEDAVAELVHMLRELTWNPAPSA